MCGEEGGRTLCVFIQGERCTNPSLCLCSDQTSRGVRGGALHRTWSQGQPQPCSYYRTESWADVLPTHIKAAPDLRTPSQSNAGRYRPFGMLLGALLALYFFKPHLHEGTDPGGPMPQALSFHLHLLLPKNTVRETSLSRDNYSSHQEH